MFVIAVIPAKELLDRYYELTGLDSVENGGLTGFPGLIMPIGSRRDAMGEAYTAISNVEAYFEGNPAATAYDNGHTLSIYHQEWIADSAVEAVVFGRSVGSFGFGAGAKLFRVPFTAYDNVGAREGTGYLAESVVALNLAIRFITHPQLEASIGANVKGAIRYVSETIANAQSAYSIPVDLGTLWRFRLLSIQNPDRLNFAVGLSIRNFGQPIAALRAPLPTVISGGIAYSPISALLFTGDLHVPVTFEPDDNPAEPLYGAFGLSISATGFFEISAGVRLRPGDYRLSLGASVHVGILSFATTYMISPATGFSPDDSLSVSMSLDLADRSETGANR